MLKSRITMEVNVDLDGVPGSFHTAEDWVSKLQHMLENYTPHYRPHVVLQEDSERDVQHYGPLTD